jgi:MYXO-CTERM domain-containing protein
MALQGTKMHDLQKHITIKRLATPASTIYAPLWLKTFAVRVPHESHAELSKMYAFSLAWFMLQTTASAAPIVFDASALDAPRVNAGSAWRTTGVFTEDIAPGEHRFVTDGIGSPSFRYSVTLDGTVEVPPDVADFVEITDGNRLTVLGYEVTVDLSALDVPRWSIPYVQPSYTTDESWTITGIPGQYQAYIRTGSGNPDIRFTISPGGNVAVRPAVAGFTRTVGNTLFVDGFDITVDASPLTAPRWTVIMEGKADYLSDIDPSLERVTQRLIPGPYQFRQRSWGLPSFQFFVTDDGTIAVSPATAKMVTLLDDDTTLRVDGYTFVVDNSASMLYFRMNIDAVPQCQPGLDEDAGICAVSGIPGRYLFSQATHGSPNFMFYLNDDGEVVLDTDDSSFTHLEDEGTTLVVDSLPFTVDWSPLTIPSARIDAIGFGWNNSALDGVEPFIDFMGIPGRYLFQQGSHGNPLFFFFLNPDGTLQRDEPTPAYTHLEDSGQTLVVDGFEFEVDPSNLTADRWRVDMTSGPWLDRTVNPGESTGIFRGIPGRYLFQQGTLGNPLLYFTVEADGTVAPTTSRMENYVSFESNPSRVVVEGMPFVVDAGTPTTAEVRVEIAGRSWDRREELACGRRIEMQGIPGRYTYYENAGAINMTFSLDENGEIYDVSVPASAFEISDNEREILIQDVGVRIDASATGQDWFITHYGNVFLDPTESFCFRGLPGTYTLVLRDGTRAVFSLQPDGTGVFENGVVNPGFQFTPDACAGLEPICDDGNGCTDDRCLADDCTNDVNTAACDDGDECTIADTCVDGGCDDAVAVPCDRDCDIDGDGIWLRDAFCRGTDCDDDAIDIFPGATDTWYDGIDSDCDRLDDFDQDGDGHASLDFADTYTGPLPADDCDDTDPTTQPGAFDAAYDGSDLNCSGDDFDQDGDGFIPDGYDELYTGALPAGDCDDRDPTVYPGSNDVPYDGVDNNCDDAAEWDLDGDGYVPTELAADYTGSLPLGDCNDDSATTYPGATDTAYDGVDADCLGNNDYDLDGDGYVPNGTNYVGDLLTGDCDDDAAGRFPGAQDQPYDAIDANCDGTDDWDADGDGHASLLYAAVYSGSGTADDCDDTNPNINPSSADAWYDGIDSDCRGNDDWDADADGHASATEAANYQGLLPTDDCDDTSPLVNPGVPDADYDGIDSDCRGDNDWDRDSDGYVPSNVGYSGDLPTGDCDDTSPRIFPTAIDAPYDAVDANCDGADDWDADGDGHASLLHAAVYRGTGTADDCDDTNADISPSTDDTPYDGIDADCRGNDDWDADADGHASAAEADNYEGLLPTDDCDDSNPQVNPDVPDIDYDGIDADCRGDDDWDRDADGYAPSDVGYEGDLPTGDCDDTDPDIYPTAEDALYDGIDTDCTGGDDYDADGDGYIPDGYAAYTGDLPAGDCDDSDATIQPGAAEAPADGVDQNCDGLDSDPIVDSGCGCSTSTQPSGSWSLLLLGGLAFLRRRRTLAAVSGLLAATNALAIDIEVDGTGLSDATLGVDGQLAQANNDVMVFDVTEGRHYVSGATPFQPRVYFDVDADGRITPEEDISSYGRVEADGQRLVLDGHTINIDVSTLDITRFRLSGTRLDWYDTRVDPAAAVTAYNLLPGTHRMDSGSVFNNTVTFQVTSAGTITVDESFQPAVQGIGNTLNVVGVELDVDWTALSTSRLNVGITDLPDFERVVDPDADHVRLTVVPGGYRFLQRSPFTPNVTVTVDSDGVHSWDPSLDGVIVHRGDNTRSAVLAGRTFIIDGSPLTTAIFDLNITGIPASNRLQSPGSDVMEITGLPGAHQLVQRSAHSPNFTFTVRNDGALEVEDELLPFIHLEDSDTTLVVDGHRMWVDFTALTSVGGHLNMPQLDPTDRRFSEDGALIEIVGIPGRYRFGQLAAHSPYFDFNLDNDGAVLITEDQAAFLHLEDNDTTLVIDGHAIRVDPTALTSSLFFISISGQVFSSSDNVFDIVTLPGRHRGQASGAHSPFIDWWVDTDGTLYWPDSQDGAMRSEDNETTLILDGYQWFLSLEDLTGTAYSTNITGLSDLSRQDLACERYQNIRGLPGRYTLSQRSWNTPSANITVGVDGTIVPSFGTTSDSVDFEPNQRIVQARGFSYIVDASGLETDRYSVNGIIPLTPIEEQTCMSVFPGRYLVQSSDTSITGEIVVNQDGTTRSVPSSGGQTVNVTFIPTNRCDPLPEPCEDGNDCTDDACDLELGCTYTPHTDSCDDGNDCTGVDTCSAGDCVPGELIDCDATCDVDFDGVWSVSCVGGEDCDDLDPLSFPGADDAWYDGIDSDCDGANDCDVDGDGVIPTAYASVCPDSPTGDCNDQDSSIYAGAVDTPYDGIDSDCDGANDCDADGDGWIPADSASTCSTGRVGDCDDTESGINPAAENTCYDGVDSDCDGADDFDCDRDGFVDIAFADTYSGDLPATDCDDGDRTINPSALDTPYDGIDSDCDGANDCDLDGDGVIPTAYASVCPESPTGDCNDQDSSIYAGAVDTPYDGIDSDCDGANDCDVDQDGWIPLTSITECPAGRLGDCDDTESTTNPAADDVCYDGVDSDCDGTDDFDCDRDGFADATFADTYSGDLPATDCNDANRAINPGEDEEPYDGIDANCDNGEEWDLDGDGYVPDDRGYDGPLPTGDCDDTEFDINPGATDVPYDGVDSDCLGEDDWDLDGDGFVPDVPGYDGPLPQGDCDDASPDVRPGAPDAIGDGLDSDCNGGEWDLDGDGHIDPIHAALYDGDLPVDDCNDSRGDIFPGAEDTCYDGVDSDCAQDSDWDCDNDGHATLTAPDDEALPTDDCDDADEMVNPSMEETWYDGVDADCAGDDDFDQDADGSAVIGFDEYPGPLLATDCNDVDPEVGPDREDILNDGIDQDCSGSDALRPVIGGGLGCTSVPAPQGWLLLVGLAGLWVRRRAAVSARTRHTESSVG